MPDKKRISRKGVSPVVGTVIIVAVTLVVGFAVMSFVRTESAASTSALGASSSSYTNQLRERFVITNLAFDITYSGGSFVSSSGYITFWVYNNGNITAGIIQVFIGKSPTSLTPVSSFSLNPTTIPISQGGFVYFRYNATGPVEPGTYYIKAVSQFGNSMTYMDKK